MPALEILVVLGVTVLIGTTLGGRFSVAPPVLLIVLGGLLGLMPALSHVGLDPDIVLFLFLPAILYWESLNTSLREIRANLRVIVMSSVGLVIITMVAVAFTAQALGMDSSAAWILGAVLAPTDASAVAGLAKRMPRRTLTTLRAESLINDGTALVLFAITVGVAVSGDIPGPVAIVARFAGSYAGGIAAGLLIGGLVVFLRRRLEDPLREAGLSVLTPFTAYLLAQAVHSSGVVAVVVSGLVLTQASPRVISARSRTQAFAFWDISTFMLNGGLFVFVGIQIPQAVRGIDSTSTARALVLALVVTLVVVGTRLLWGHLATFAVRAIDRRDVQRARRVDWRTRTAVGWAGFRGAVSLAAALAVPSAINSGDRLPDRDLLVFTTSVVILLTIIVQGTTLPAVIRWARLPEDTARQEELQLAQRSAARAGLNALPQVAADLGVDGELLDQVRQEYQKHLELTGWGNSPSDGDQARDQARHQAKDRVRDLKLGVLAYKRQAVTELRDANRIDDIVLREVQATMDAEEVRLLGPVPAE